MLRKLPLIGAFVLAMSANGPAAAATAPRVLMKTSMGDITIELYPDKAPKTVANFLQYVKEGFYSGTVFHRVINGFMVQGGGMTKDLYNGGSGRKETHAPIELESRNGLKNDTGWVAMARTSVPNSATSQFFINLFDRNQFLDDAAAPGQPPAGYTAFGKVVEGMDVVDKIAKVETAEGLLTDENGRRAPAEDVPTKPVVIKSIKRAKAAK